VPASRATNTIASTYAVFSCGLSDMKSAMSCLEKVIAP
jgi:hypothetical protein